jgi:hypothetical protein
MTSDTGMVCRQVICYSLIKLKIEHAVDNEHVKTALGTCAERVDENYSMYLLPSI